MLSSMRDGGILALSIPKFSRFFRRYDLRFGPRHKGAPALPLARKDALPSVIEALEDRIKAEKALEVMPNGDIVELMSVEYRAGQKCLVLLFHCASPNAADLMYRRKAREAAGIKVTVRASVKAPDEEETVSAHLVIRDQPAAAGVYRAALEDMQGISMSTVRAIIALALREYPYEFKRDNEPIETYSVVRAEGLKSESMTNALKTGHLGFVTLSRPAASQFPDSAGMFQPTTEVMKLRIIGNITSENWKESFAKLLKPAQAAGWRDFTVDIGLDDNKSRTVSLVRDQEAKEILFVRSELAEFPTVLETCSMEFSDKIIATALSIISRA